MEAERIVQHLLTERNLSAACIDAKTAVNHDTRWTKRINAAYEVLGYKQWLFNGRVLRVRSSDGTQVYTVTDRHCDCIGASYGATCKHIVAHRLIVNALAHGKPDAEWTAEVEAHKARVRADFLSKAEVLLRVSPAEAVVDALNEAAADADFVAYTDALNDEMFG